MLFKRKQKVNRDPCKVLFKNKSSRRVKPRPRSFASKMCPIKPLRSNRNPRFEKIKKQKRKSNILNIAFLFLLIVVFSTLGYITINFIISIRGGTSVHDIDLEEKYVQGIASIPRYPKSEFVYKDLKDQEAVLKMLNQGISVYKLPRGTKSTEVYRYYEENLPHYEWEYLFTVPTSTQTELFGQYWLKGEKGLRIYVENNDVWYELILKTEASIALKERREQEIQRKRILEASSEQTLLPDYPWVLTIPKEYLTRYFSTDVGELQAVEIFEIGGTTKFLIYPLGSSGDETYDKLLHDFVTKQSEETEESWEIINTYVDYKKDREVLIAKMLIESNEGEGIVLMNLRNFVAYAIVSNEVGHPMFEQIINEIHEP